MLIEWILGLIGLLLGAVILADWRFGLHNLLIKQRRILRREVAWEDHGPTPLGEARYTPQGMTWVDGRLIFANTWKDRKSRVYEIDPDDMKILRYFDMPEGAVHTSGLAWDGKCLWAVDHRSNLAYKLDLEPSLSTGRASVIGSFETTLKGTSACCLIEWNNGRYLAISDFMESRRTLFVRHEQAVERGTAAGLLEFSYKNEGFSQGLEFIGGYLYESENKRATDVINKMDLKILTESRNARRATVRQYSAPGRGVEDLAWDGKRLWTSDEVVFRFFKAILDDY